MYDPPEDIEKLKTSTWSVTFTSLRDVQLTHWIQQILILPYDLTLLHVWTKWSN